MSILGRIFGKRNHSQVTTSNGGVVITGNVRGSVISSGGSYESTPMLEGNGELSEETRDLAQPFDKVEISNGILAKIQVGQDNDGLQLSGDSNILSEIETRIENGKLHIGPKDNANINPKNPIEATFFMADLTGLTASTSAAVKASGLASSALKLDASTSAHIEVSGSADQIEANSSTSSSIVASGIAANSVEAEAANSGSIKLSGNSNTADFEASTSGSIDASDLNSRRVTAEASTSGNLSVNPTDELNAEVSTSGSIFYQQEPGILNTDVSITGGTILLR